MKLKKLLSDNNIYKDGDVVITGIASDSRQVMPGYLFIACKGEVIDGRDYIDQAIDNGAVAILKDIEAPEDLSSFIEDFSPQCLGYNNLSDSKKNHNDSSDSIGEVTIYRSVSIVYIPNLSKIYGDIVSRFYQYPSKHQLVTGITGTNGKTTCSYWLAALLEKLGKSSVYIGSLGMGELSALVDTGNTTPSAQVIQDFLKNIDAGSYVSMEVSSHAIDQGRISGVDFDVAVFTNLSRDHLDYHASLAEYANIKKSFFDSDKDCYVINADDTVGRELIAELPKEKVISYSAVANIPGSRLMTLEDSDTEQHHDSAHLGRDESKVFPVSEITFNKNKIITDIKTPWGEGRLELPAIGLFNLSNILAVISVLGYYGFALEAILSVIKNLTQVPGRLESFGGGGKQPLVIIDYAHTPDALENVLNTLKSQLNNQKDFLSFPQSKSEVALSGYLEEGKKNLVKNLNSCSESGVFEGGSNPGKLYCVFGCGGDRDSGKRPLMARAVEKYADIIWVADDNPRTECPQSIMQDIMSGFIDKSKVTQCHDRAMAICQAISQANENDIILVAGKGWDEYQEVRGVKHAYSDIEEVVDNLSVRVGKLSNEASKLAVPGDAS